MGGKALESDTWKNHKKNTSLKKMSFLIRLVHAVVVPALRALASGRCRPSRARVGTPPASSASPACPARP